jgi:hypothetical protein
MTIQNDLSSKSCDALNADLQRFITVLRHSKRMSNIARTTLQLRVDEHLNEKLSRIAS